MPDTNVSSVLSTTSSFLISALITSSYVGGLYIAQSARLLFLKTSHQAGAQRIQKPVEWRRDDDEVIRARLQAAVLATCASCAIVYACVGLGYHDEVSDNHPRCIDLAEVFFEGQMVESCKNYPTINRAQPIWDWIPFYFTQPIDPSVILWSVDSTISVFDSTTSTPLVIPGKFAPHIYHMDWYKEPYCCKFESHSFLECLSYYPRPPSPKSWSSEGP